nr:Chain C, Gag polyprotein [Feline immunodeficiency virus (isolate Petaluma)]
RMANVSTGR